ncbi:UDP-glucose 4-epimerase [Caulifigura coniformis]|uniref:UDP-glucose 4-epimerase n=1 Tax=Caulifigura coniformis TaxID=2527983 RepID=A0A517SKN7_9PLAN|nr:NAD-dependent epimerase/dehydratase family protein [Caulifigura coniformis]QDT56687.1 UDP-glucose 4-epimerase [Caulifigura coniformis]
MSEAWQGRRVVVTGGLGFIGSNLVLRLAGEGAEATVIDLPDPECAGDFRHLGPVADRVTVIRADLSLPGDWRRAIENAEVVFHLAGQVSHSASMSDPVADLRHNCGSLLQVLEAARAARTSPRLVFASTRQVYGRAIALPVRESHPLRPPDVNGVHNVAGEEYLRLYREVHGLQSTTIRLANTYGPRMDLRHAGRGVLNVFLARALLGQPITIFGDGSQKRDINHVDDVVEALLLAARVNQAGPFHLGSPVPATLSDFLQALQTRLPVEVSHQPFPPELEAIDIGDSHCDIAAFQAATGWSPATPLDEGLARTIKWFLSNPHALPRAATR